MNGTAASGRQRRRRVRRPGSPPPGGGGISRPRSALITGLAGGLDGTA
jgi:hypothetical protein